MWINAAGAQGDTVANIEALAGLETAPNRVTAMPLPIRLSATDAPVKRIEMSYQRRLRFTDRFDAARQLATALSSYRGSHPLVLAIPRGGVPIGRVVADALRGELD